MTWNSRSGIDLTNTVFCKEYCQEFMNHL